MANGNDGAFAVRRGTEGTCPPGTETLGLEYWTNAVEPSAASVTNVATGFCLLGSSSLRRLRDLMSLVTWCLGKIPGAPDETAG